MHFISIREPGKLLCTVFALAAVFFYLLSLQSSVILLKQIAIMLNRMTSIDYAGCFYKLVKYLLVT